ncbi:hypothetical protein KDK88_10455, partial [bacterium]|nr:hypothetical protein [bacterium]
MNTGLVEFFQACAMMAATGVSLLGGVALYRHVRVRGWRSALAVAAGELGLTPVKAVRGLRLAGAIGRLGPATLALEAESRDRDAPATTRCRVSADIPRGVLLMGDALHLDEAPQSVSAVERHPDYETLGVRTAAQQATTQALLDAPLRARLRAARRWRLEVATRVASLSRDGLVDDAAELVAMARLALDVAAALDGVDLVGRLEQTALTDADADRALAACFARLGHPDRDDFLQRASRQAATGGVRLVAARR